MHPLLIEILKNSDFLASAAGFLSVFASFYIFKSTRKTTLEHERYHSLIFPLFELLEPYLFKEKNDAIFRKALSLIRTKKSLLGGKLMPLVYWNDNDPSDENFKTLCSLVNSEFDRSCTMLGLKKRSMSYRFNHDQYRTKLSLLAHMLVFIATQLCFAVFCLCFFLLFAGLLFKLLGFPE